MEGSSAGIAIMIIRDIHGVVRGGAEDLDSCISLLNYYRTI